MGRGHTWEGVSVGWDSPFASLRRDFPVSFPVFPDPYLAAAGAPECLLAAADATSLGVSLAFEVLSPDRPHPTADVLSLASQV